MKHLFSLFLVFGTCLDASTAFAGNNFSEVFRAHSVEALQTIVARSRTLHRRMRGCEIQRREGVPPTLCYPAKNPVEIDSECVRATRVAVRLPSSDEFTSKVCRDAIETRSKDLVYARERDALR